MVCCLMKAVAWDVVISRSGDPKRVTELSKHQSEIIQRFYPLERVYDVIFRVAERCALKFEWESG